MLYHAARESIDDISPWEAWCHKKMTINNTLTYLRKCPRNWSNGTGYDFAVVDSRDLTILGACGLSHIDKENRFANAGYWIRSSKTKLGIATIATRLLVNFAFQTLKLIRVEITAAVDNTASQRVAIKVGAKREGILRKRHVVNNDIQDVVMFSVINTDPT
jgi:RimJ/RimL family protein N-acetyltransferase